MTQRPYTYTVLRYVHDVRTDEFLNVGIVLHLAGERRPRVRIRKTFGRAKAMFPDLDGEAFRDAMAAVTRALSPGVQDAAGDQDAIFHARRAMPVDDSTLQWSPPGSGLTDDPEGTLQRLYQRLVARYDTTQQTRRTDADIWRPVRDKLAQRAITIALEAKTVVGASDAITFSHAWRNGRWHAYEPLSLDLAEAEGIKDKARRWRGHLDAVAGGQAEPIALHLIVGAPQNPSLQPAYQGALAILRQANFQPRLFEDHQLDELVDAIEDEVRQHAQTTG